VASGTLVVANPADQAPSPKDRVGGSQRQEQRVSSTRAKGWHGRRLIGSLGATEESPKTDPDRGVKHHNRVGAIGSDVQAPLEVSIEDPRVALHDRSLGTLKLGCCGGFPIRGPEEPVEMRNFDVEILAKQSCKCRLAGSRWPNDDDSFHDLDLLLRLAIGRITTLGAHRRECPARRAARERPVPRRVMP